MTEFWHLAKNRLELSLVETRFVPAYLVVNVKATRVNHIVFKFEILFSGKGTVKAAFSPIILPQTFFDQLVWVDLYRTIL